VTTLLTYLSGGDYSIFSPLNNDASGGCVANGDDGRLSLATQLLPANQQVR